MPGMIIGFHVMAVSVQLRAQLQTLRNESQITLIKPTRQWDMGELRAKFLPMDVATIQAIPISSRVQADFWAWHHDKKGIFSVRSAYRMLACTKERREAWLYSTAIGSDHQGLQKSWTSLWHIQVPSKLRIFLWRLVKQSLPSSDLLLRRHVSPVRNCAICGREDSRRHSLIDCYTPSLTAIWLGVSGL